MAGVSEGIGHLGRLIEDTRSVHGWSYDDLAERARAVPSKSMVHKLAIGKWTRLPSPDVLDGLARALGVPERVVVAAALADLGMLRHVEVPADEREETPVELRQRIERSAVSPEVKRLLLAALDVELSPTRVNRGESA